ncbi:MAG: hypothetical protein QXG10_04600 [Candidatus Hadarchaeales archaeon]
MRDEEHAVSVALIILLSIAIAIGVAMLVVVTGMLAIREGSSGGGASGGLPEEHFSVDAVYFENFVDFMGNVSPDTFSLVVEITSGGRWVREWSIGIDYGGGTGFVDNVLQGGLGGHPDPETHKITLREGVSKWYLDGSTHPMPGQSYYVKLTFSLSDDSVFIWDGHAGYR